MDEILDQKTAMDEVLNRGKTTENLKLRLTPTPPRLRGMDLEIKRFFGKTII